VKKISLFTPIPAAIALMLLTSCMTTGVQRYSPNFDYSPPRDTRPAATNVTFAVVDASYPDLIPIFQQFGQNMSQDFFEILTARGFTIRGPFRTYDDVTFTDKKGSDLLLIPDLQISGDGSGIKWEPSLGAALFGKTGYTGEGNLVIKGRVNLVVAESMSKEKMWTKSVEIQPVTVPIEETRMYASPSISVRDLITNEDAIYNSVAQALETQYKTILENAYRYLDPDEMQLVKKQSQEIRTRKVY
jgi:neuraminyllactose-binding hemagglutinin